MGNTDSTYNKIGDIPDATAIIINDSHIHRLTGWRVNIFLLEEKIVLVRTDDVTAPVKSILYENIQKCTTENLNWRLYYSSKSLFRAHRVLEFSLQYNTPSAAELSTMLHQSMEPLLYLT